MSQTPFRTLSIFQKGNTYTIFDTDGGIHLFTIRFNSHFAPQMTVFHASNTDSIVGSATYHAMKNFGLSTASRIILKLPSSSGTVSLDKEGGFFSNNKRTLPSKVLGQVYWTSRLANNPWKGGRLETSFMKLADTSGKTLVEYKDEDYTLKRLGVLEIHVELTREGLEEVVVSGMAMLSEEQTGVKS